MVEHAIIIPSSVSAQGNGKKNKSNNNNKAEGRLRPLFLLLLSHCGSCFVGRVSWVRGACAATGCGGTRRVVRAACRAVRALRRRCCSVATCAARAGVSSGTCEPSNPSPSASPDTHKTTRRSPRPSCTRRASSRRSCSTCAQGLLDVQRHRKPRRHRSGPRSSTPPQLAGSETAAKPWLRADGSRTSRQTQTGPVIISLRRVVVKLLPFSSSINPPTHPLF